MRYTNIKTGAVIETDCIIAGDNWEETKPSTKGKSKKNKEESNTNDPHENSNKESNGEKAEGE